MVNLIPQGGDRGRARGAIQSLAVLRRKGCATGSAGKGLAGEESYGCFAVRNFRRWGSPVGCRSDDERFGAHRGAKAQREAFARRGQGAETRDEKGAKTHGQTAEDEEGPGPDPVSAWS